MVILKFTPIVFLFTSCCIQLLLLIITFVNNNNYYCKQPCMLNLTMQIFHQMTNFRGKMSNTNTTPFMPSSSSSSVHLALNIIWSSSHFWMFSLPKYEYKTKRFYELLRLFLMTSLKSVPMMIRCIWILDIVV